VKLKKLEIIFIVLIILASAIVISEPTGPMSIEVGQSQRGPITPAKQVDAQAGNVTELSINATSITRAWQGYFGNITGTITLDNANNWTLYDWRMALPSGKVFSTRNETAINWNTLSCANTANITQEDTIMGNTGMVDAINETFKYVSGSLTVGNTALNSCPATYTYVNDTNQTSLFQEVIIMDTSKNALIFTSIIEPHRTGFDNRTHDFQMIVPENGRNGDVATTKYYFYVELN
jgi:hypothetical protein